MFLDTFVNLLRYKPSPSDISTWTHMHIYTGTRTCARTHTHTHTPKYWIHSRNLLSLKPIHEFQVKNPFAEYFSASERCENNPNSVVLE